MPMPHLSDLDKKRHKLGYQRISIACAHCRRRKIRCLLSDDDGEQRCQTCIRLKRECVFYPVPHQAASDARSESSSRSGAPPSEPSSAVSTSPPQPGARAVEQQSHPFGSGFHHFSPGSAAAVQGIPIPPGNLQAQGDFSPQPYHYAVPSQSRQPWSPLHYDTYSQRIPTDNEAHLHPPLTRYAAVGADVAPFPPSEQQSPNPSQPHSFPHMTNPGLQCKQPQPARAVSYVGCHGPSVPHQVPSSVVRPPSYSGHPDPRMLHSTPDQGSLQPHPQYPM